MLFILTFLERIIKIAKILEEMVKYSNNFLLGNKIFIFIPFIMVICVVLSLFTHMIPAHAVSENIKDSLSSFSNTVSYPQIIKGNVGTQLDDFTDAIILNTASYDGHESVLEKMASNYRIINGDPNESLHSYGRNDINKTAYARYWIGSIFFVKVLLLFLDYPDIQVLNFILQFVFLSIFIYQLSVRKLSRYLIPFISAIIWIMPIIIPLSLQFSPMYYVSLISMLLLLFMYSSKGFRFLHTSRVFIVIFACIGVITNWLDFLTFPIITLGFPLSLLLILCASENQDLNVKDVILICFAWGSGYACMWILKWLLATIILQRNVFEEAFNSIIFRTSENVASETFTRVDVILKNISVMWKRPVIFGFIITILYCLKKVFQNIKQNGVGTPLFIRRTMCFGVIMLLPFGWYFVLGNHSFEHYWFTFRSLSVAILAVLSYLLISYDNFSGNT